MATCQGGVYIVSKHNYAQLTHINHYSTVAGAWSGNLIGAATPFELLPNPTFTDDLVVFGINTTAAAFGPFCNLVLNIERVFGDVSDSVTTLWRVGTAGGDPKTWQSMAYGTPRGALDCTNQDARGTGIFADTLGIGSVAWDQRFITFASQDPTIGGVALGVTGYWVCLHVTAADVGGEVPPRQGERNVYTVTWPYFDIEADELEGDLPAIPKLILTNQSDVSVGSGAQDPAKWHSNIVIASRSLTRQGIDCSDFSPYLNASEEQNPLGVTCTPNGVAACAFTAMNECATGDYCAIPNPPGLVPGAGFTNILRWDIDTIYSPQYYGTYHAYLILLWYGAPEELEVRLDVGVFDVTEQQHGPYRPDNSPLRFEVMDFGQVSIAPPAVLLPTEPVDIRIDVMARSSAAGLNALGIYGLVLMPTDEWASEYEAPWDENYGPVGSVDYRAVIGYRGLGLAPGLQQQKRYLVVDGFGVPKGPPRAILMREDTGEAIYPWRVLGPPPRIQPYTTQRIWFFSRWFENGDWMAEPEYLLSVDMEAQERYSSARGDR